MQPNLTMVLEQVGKDKGIDVKILLQTLEQAILTAAKKVFGMHRELEAQYNNEPNWRGALSADYASLMAAAGFGDVKVGYQSTATDAHKSPKVFKDQSDGVFRSWFVASGRA